MQEAETVESSDLTISASATEAAAKCFSEIHWKSNPRFPSKHLGDYTYLLKKRENVWKIVFIQL